MPAKETTKIEKVPRISATDPQVVLHPEDNDLMVRTGKQVIDACHLNISIELWLHEYNALALHLAEWAKATPSVQSVHMAPRGSRVAIFVSPKSDVFDFDLADTLALLRAGLVKTFKVGMVEILQIPSEELDRFVDGTRARVIYVEQAGSHHAVEA